MRQESSWVWFYVFIHLFVILPSFENTILKLRYGRVTVYLFIYLF